MVNYLGTNVEWSPSSSAGTSPVRSRDKSARPSTTRSVSWSPERTARMFPASSAPRSPGKTAGMFPVRSVARSPDRAVEPTPGNVISTELHSNQGVKVSPLYYLQSFNVSSHKIVLGSILRAKCSKFSMYYQMMVGLFVIMMTWCLQNPWTRQHLPANLLDLQFKIN